MNRSFDAQLLGGHLPALQSVLPDFFFLLACFGLNVHCKMYTVHCAAILISDSTGNRGSQIYFTRLNFIAVTAMRVSIARMLVALLIGQHIKQR